MEILILIPLLLLLLLLLLVNSDRKAAKYHPLLTNLRAEYTYINFVNFSMSALSIFGTSSDTFLQMLNDLNFKKI